jgi:hypothetical protein
MVLKVVKALIPLVGMLVKDLQDGKLSAEERETLILTFATAVAELVGDITGKK